MQQAIQQDIAAIQAIEAVPHIMNILSEATGLRFICVARVTEDEVVLTFVVRSFHHEPSMSTGVES